MASMDVMREYVSRQYSGVWPERVKRMRDDQVTAIYYKMIHELEKAKNAKSEPKLTESEVRGGTQLCLFEGDHGTRIKEGYLQ